MNPYRYVHNSPTNATDLSGLYFVVQGDEYSKKWLQRLRAEPFGLNVAMAPTSDLQYDQIYLVDQESKDRVADLLKNNTQLANLYKALLYETTYDAVSKAKDDLSFSADKLSKDMRRDMP